jgi:hypothetical protein
MKRRVITLLAVLLIIDFVPPWVEAQTPPATSNAATQNPAMQNPQGGPQIQSSASSVPATVIAGQTTVGLNSAASSISASTTNSPFVSVGQGLPGMPGGPRLGAAGGAADQSGDYMTPPIVGPLFCDPAINIPC